MRATAAWRGVDFDCDAMYGCARPRACAVTGILTIHAACCYRYVIPHRYPVTTVLRNPLQFGIPFPFQVWATLTTPARCWHV